MVRWFISLILVIVLIVAQRPYAAAGDTAPPRPVSAEAAALFGLQPADEDEEQEEEEDEDADKSEDEPEEADESEDSESEATEEKEEPAEEEEEEKADEKSDDDAEKQETKSAKAKAEKDQTESRKKDEKPADTKKSTKEKPAEQEKDAGKKPEETKPVIHKVKKKDLKVEVETEGVFVAEETEEVPLRPEVWSSFKVVEAVPHGKRVRKGEVLVKFDEKDIDEALEEKSLEQRLGELALMEAEEEFPRLEKSIELNYDQAKREYDQAVDERERFQKTMREMSEKLAEYYLKSAEQEFANAQEELEQLEKMYAADELTEETEEIVLKRQKFQVEAARFFVDYSKINHDYTVNVSIPRREESLDTAVELAKIEFERAKMAKSLGMNEQRYQLQALREARAKSVDNHAKLEEDRNLMVLKAPSDGIAYYGRCVNGRWIEVSSLESKLVPFGAVTPNSVVFTIVKDRPFYVETSIGEKELPTVEADQPVTVSPLADAEVELKGKVKKVADVPGGGNKFAVHIEIEAEKAPDWLMPGMTSKAKITTYDVEDAVVIPAELVQSDEDDPKKKYVMVQVEDEEKPVRREIKLGKTKDKEVEVLKGLKEGDEIVKGAKDEKAEDENGDEEKDADEKKE